MDKRKELLEAKTAARDVVARIDHALSKLENASAWSWLDLLGGGFLSSLIKREQIQRANQNIDEVRQAMTRLNRELEDIHMRLPDTISDTLSDSVLDVWFDNIFTDVRVQGEIKDTLKALQGFRADVLALIARLESEIDQL